MATITFKEVWQNPHYDDFNIIGDGRIAGIYRSDTGTINYTTKSSFDYFPDTATVGDYIMFHNTRRFWGVKIYVGTPLQASSITIEWEYYASDGTWKHLPVDNTNPFSSSGWQEVKFTAPADWGRFTQGGYNKGLYVRAKITAVSGLTEGGANSTNPIKYRLMYMQVTGTITSFSYFTSQDNNETYTILDAVTPAASLEPLEMPVKTLDRMSKVDVIISSSTTIGAGDTVDITGEDVEGNTLSETIDVSAGNGTYTSSLAYANITDIACNGFNDGTITVKQKIGGLIKNVSFPSAEYKNMYLINAIVEIGDGTTETSVSIIVHTLWFVPGNYFRVHSNATFQTGVGDYNQPRYGCAIIMNNPYEYSFFLLGDYGANIYHYATAFIFTGVGIQNGVIVNYPGNNLILQACLFTGDGDGSYSIWDRHNYDIKIKDTYFANGFWLRTTLTDDSENVTFGRTSHLEINNKVVTLVEPKTYSDYKMHVYSVNGRFDFVDSRDDDPKSVIIRYNTGDYTDRVRIIWTFNLKVVDSNGNGIEGATVTLKDKDGSQVFSVTTDGNGDIAEQQVIQAKADQTDSNPYIWTDYNPFTLTISKTGYKTMVKEYTIDRKINEVEVLENRREV